MYKLLIVEDEPLVRLGLRTTINWEKLNIEIVGEAKNGVEGFKMAVDLNPDIIITDVKMPLKSGTEMIEELRQAGNNSEIIILSGFGEFEYAKSAIQNNVSFYLLKPISNEELIDAITKLIEKIENDRNKSFVYDLVDSSKEDLRRKIIRSLVRKDYTSKEDIFKEAKMHGYDLNGESLFLIGVLDDVDQESPNELFVFEELLSNELKVGGIDNLGAIYHDKVSFLIKKCDLDELENLITNVFNKYSEKYDRTFSIGVSSSFSSIENVHKAYEEAKSVAMNGLMKFMNSVQIFNQESSVYPPNLIRALDIIRKEYNQNINVGYVSEKLNVSESYLMHLFKEKLGKTFNNILVDTRIRNAKAQLLTGKLRVNEVAYNVGFNDEKYFTMIFKKYVNMTPSEFIKKNEKKINPSK